MRIHWFLAGVSTFALGAFAQVQSVTSASATSNQGTAQGTMGFGGRSFMGSPVTGAPYSAQRVFERVQVGADGTRFTQTNRQETIYRDSQGRVRTERQFMMGPNTPADAPLIVEIQDPVGGYSYTLDTQNKVAHRVALQTPEMRRVVTGGLVTSSNTTAMVSTGVLSAGPIPPPPPPPPSTGAMTSRPRPEMKNEELGTQVIEGVVAQGQRHTQMWTTGAQGNDRPFQVVTETWFSTDLKEMVLNKTTDPRSGENTTKLININLGEPSADLFMPPADYQIVDENGPFQIHWTAARQ